MLPPFHLARRRPLSPAPYVAAVSAALAHELSVDPEASAHLLGVADVLLHRAVLEDLAPVRRAASAAHVAAALEGVGPQSTGDSWSGLARAADVLTGADAPRSVLVELLRRLATTDLPELGSASTPDREAAAAAAMDWLGRDTPAVVAPEAVSAYLRGWRDDVDVVSVRQLSGGFSKATLLVTLRRPGRVEEVVLRQVLPGRDAGGLVAEYGVVRFAWQGGVPAPEPLWLEPEDNPLGGPFFASRRVPGVNVGDVFGPRGDVDRSVALDLASALAALHALDVGDLATPVPPMATDDQVLARVAEQEDLVAQVCAATTAGPQPLHAMLFSWLTKNAPAGGLVPVLLHGDPGFHNLLVHDGRAQALLDWERARVGDAAQDLAYVRPHVTRVLPWPEFLAAYASAGGTAPDEERMRWYAVWHDTWRFAGAYRGRARLLADPRSLLDATIGLLHAPRFLLGALTTAFEVEL